ncbi:MAG TPA: PstS family phosphate ABC transporter substrate-binding protein [Paludibacteraceae bacterium]|jgi:phosphate transport system substrate-binding protein|nr:PstS family phosphate ABC transporter substrate-binding protein [Paludibacteraceae bacterium]HOU67634.1 PstS family phosphate ABC transporter substrate-binding protein [Paludibacteraceae bacterium]HPH62477.1 PstS family phosphate ABC transporter substrate-binding protein [Paludibacteraceae bacterium]HQF49662.1 PstS family phosphate ABC transporter substrate-binding protein [Paludibacteraceae bacterium]HQJ90967.1 PstS family phosphate ABC transporter substrate-binding protein [Paludibacterace
MKKIMIAIALIIGSTLIQTQAQKIKGSDTCLPLTQKEAENYMKANSKNRMTVVGGGSGVGFAALTEGSTDIAMSSRKIKFDEKMKIQDGGNSVKEVIIAYDALTIIVNPKNKVSKLTREQLAGIFSGKITNWKEVGGADMKIIPYSRETSSGTYEFFKSSVLKNKNYMNGIMSMPATGAIVQSVTQTPGAIGYIGLAYLNKNVKALAVSYDGGKKYVSPSVESAMDKTYPVVRPLYFYYLNKDQKKVTPFISYVLSSEGQKTVSEIGFIPVK